MIPQALGFLPPTHIPRNGSWLLPSPAVVGSKRGEGGLSLFSCLVNKKLNKCIFLLISWKPLAFTFSFLHLLLLLNLVWEPCVVLAAPLESSALRSLSLSLCILPSALSSS